MKKHVALLTIAILLTINLSLYKLSSATPAESKTPTPSSATATAATEIQEQALTKTTFENLPPETTVSAFVAIFLGVGILLVYAKKTQNQNHPAHCPELI